MRLADLVIELAQQDAGVVGPLDRSVLIRAAEGGEKIDHAWLDARRVGLLGLAESLFIVGQEVEQPVSPDWPAERGASLLLIERELLAR